MPFQVRRLSIPDVLLIEPRVFRDARGLFMETYKQSELAAHGITCGFVQDNFSRSVRGVLRGLHYQKPPKAQAKLVMVLRGEVYDVAVDIRQGSPTYGRWVGVWLTDRTPQMLFIPEGFAHGFCVVSEQADFGYKVSAEYAPELDAGILWSDPQLAIEWPVQKPLLSPKDLRLPPLAEAGTDFVYEGLCSAGM
jgi:dTDP-4-dehydrorhamnose 3,5-epimerase